MASHSWNALILTHTLAASTAVLLGAWLLRARKGHRAHRIGGWIWVLCMVTVVGVSFGIRRPEGYSWIHGLSVFTLVTLATGVIAARTHRVRAHRINMTGLYLGALIVTGLFTLLPGRLLGQAFWSWFGGS
jgi:uncharacterized membrane protein